MSITARDFAKENAHSDFAFSADKESLLAGLAKLADMVRSDQVCVSRVAMTEEVGHEDFVTKTLTLKFAERRGK